MSVAAPAELKRTDSLDMRRAGTVSEDERAVLRIEWRAGLSGVDADRSVQEIMAKLRQMETSVASVSQLIRNMPSEKRAAPVSPVNSAPSGAAEDESGTGPDWRLMAANLTAIVLVLVWWTSRRKTQKAAAALEAQLAAKARAEPTAPTDAGPVADIADSPPTASLIAELTFDGPRADLAAHIAEPPPIPDPAPPFAHAAEPPLAVPGEGVLPGDDRLASAAVPEPPPADIPPLVDFVLEEADPTTVVPERPRPASRTANPITPESVSASLNKNVEPTLQLAEIMLSMGLEQGAAQALVEYTEANPRHAIYHMLKLLGIYRKRGLHKEFQETAEKLRKNFNIQAEDWGTTQSGEAPSLEKFSRVAQHVQSIWNQPSECTAYLRHLLEDNRDGARAGFPQSVAEEILLLVEILKETSGAAQTPA